MPTALTDAVPVADEDLIVAEARRDLAIYLGLLHRTDEGGAAIPPRHLLEQVIPAVMDDSLGHTLIVAPPGSAKTNTMIGACAWWLGHDPSVHLAYVCDAQPRAVQRSLAVRAMVEESPEFHALFPEARADYRRGWAQDEWYLLRPNRMDKNASFFAAGMDSSILGARLDRVVLDDVWNQKIADSETEKARAFTKLEKEIMTRLHPQRGRAIGICTRWGEDDFAAWAMEKKWHTIVIPAIDDAGKSYWEDYWPRSKLRCVDDEHDPDLQCCIYASMSSMSFGQQYMGVVMPEEGARFKPSWWRRYEREPDEWDKGCITVDTAGWDAHTTTGDFCVANAWCRVGHDYYNLWVERGRWAFNEVERVVVEMQAAYGLPVLVEDVPWARPLIDRLRKVAWGVIAWKVQGHSKENRADSVLHLVETGHCWLPESAGWVDGYVQRLAAFPKGKYDDEVDTTTMALMYLSARAGAKKQPQRQPFSRRWEQLTA